MGAAFTHSQNKQIDTAVAGYMSGNKFEELVRTGAYNPFVSNPGAAATLARFKAPTMNNVADPLKNAGSSNAFPCRFAGVPAAVEPRAVYCRPGSSEYGLLDRGNPATGAGALQPETSKQATLGFRLEPTTAISFGLDMWDVKLKNQIRTFSQDQLFTNPVLAKQWIAVYADPIQKSNVLVAVRTPLNLASSHFRGLDWDTTLRSNTPIGRASVNGRHPQPAGQGDPPFSVFFWPGRARRRSAGVA